MKNIAEVKFELTGETRKYFIFSIKGFSKDNPEMYPEKIYLRKDLFPKKKEKIEVTIN